MVFNMGKQDDSHVSGNCEELRDTDIFTYKKYKLHEQDEVLAEGEFSQCFVKLL